MKSSVLHCVFLLAGGVVTAAALSSSINGYSGIDCSLLAPAYCTADLGCTLQGDSCKADPAIKPELNCSLLQGRSGGAVQDMEQAMILALKGLKDLSKTVGSTTAEAIEKFVDVQKEWDSCMQGYNKSLSSYSNEAAALDTLQAELIELEKNCSASSPPPGCAKVIEEMQMEVLEQNATSAKAWITCILMQQKLLLAESEVRTGNDEISKTTELAQKAYADASTKIADSTKAKQDALNFWNVIKDMCIHAAPVASSTTSLSPPSVSSSRRLSARARLRRKMRKITANVN